MFQVLSNWARARRVSHDIARAFTCFAFAILLHPTAVAAQSLSASWQQASIGSPTLTGEAEEQACTAVATECQAFAITAAGTDIWGAADQFHYVYRPWTGDGAFTVRVASLENTHASAKAGVMIRESLAPGSRHAHAFVTPGKGVAFERRRTTGGVSTNMSGGAGAAAVWLKLERSGNLVTASRSIDGRTWTRIGSDTLTLSQTVYVGMAVTSHVPYMQTTAHVSDVTFRSLMPEPWSSSDVGAPQIAGTASYAQGSFSLSGAGVDVWGTADQFRYVYQRVSGDVDIVARVTNLTKNHAWTKAGVMFRESLDAGAAQASAFVSSGKGIAFQRRPAAGALSVNTSGPAAAAPAWVKLERRADVVTALSSVDGVAWTVIGHEVMTLPDTFYVGLALTSHVPSSVAYATVSDVTITANEVSAPNKAPTVTITAPSAAALTVGQNVAVNAAAADTDGTVAGVDFYVDGTLIGTDATAPYSVAWQADGAGVRTLTAIARDDDGDFAVSAAAAVTVIAPARTVRAAFAPSADHAAVDSYALHVRPAGAAAGASPLKTINLGKPVVINGECAVDITAAISSLPAGAYVAVVEARSAGGAAASAPSAFTR